MSRTDSGLGWSCDSAYYVYSAGTYLGRNAHGAFYKVNDGPAIAMFAIADNGQGGPLLMSTVPEYAYTTMYEVYSEQLEIDGVIWYLNAGYWNGSPVNDSAFPTEYGFPWNHSRNFVQMVIDIARVLVNSISQTIPVQFVRQGGYCQTASILQSDRPNLRPLSEGGGVRWR